MAAVPDQAAARWLAPVYQHLQHRLPDRFLAAFHQFLSFLWIEPPGAARRNRLQAVRRVMYGCRLRLRHARATIPTYPVQNVDRDGNERWNHRLYGYGFRYPRFDVRSRPYRPTLTNHHHKCYRKTPDAVRWSVNRDRCRNFYQSKTTIDVHADEKHGFPSGLHADS